MTDVNTQTRNYVCFSQFATDLSNKELPNLPWLISPYSIAGHKQTSGDPQAYNKGYDEGNILRTIAQGLGVPTTNLGWADTAVAMTEFFQ